MARNPEFTAGYGQALQRAIGETDRRRTRQVAFNTAHDITPKGIVKSVRDMIDGMYDPQAGQICLKAAQDGLVWSLARRTDSELSTQTSN